MTFEVLIPTYESNVEPLRVTDRVDSLAGGTVGIVSNGKLGTVPFFDEVERVLRDDYGVASVVRTIKSDYSAPADPEVMNAAQHWHALIAGIGD